jgi:hypothetical protein
LWQPVFKQRLVDAGSDDVGGVGYSTVELMVGGWKRAVFRIEDEHAGQAAAAKFFQLFELALVLKAASEGILDFGFAIWDWGRGDLGFEI